MIEPIQVTSHVSRDFLQNSAYFNTVPKVVWEYVSNSVDNPKQNQSVHVEVKISKERIVISDTGCGMTRQELSNFFQMHAENIRRRRGESVRGRYGTGKCAAFGIADVLRVETVKEGLLNVVELSREDIEKSKSGEPFSVRTIIADKATTEVGGTTIIISKLNIKNIDLHVTISYVERHLGRQLQNNTVIINEHPCEYEEPFSSWEKRYHPRPDTKEKLGDIELIIKVSPIPLDTERTGIDILSKGIWHDTTLGNIDKDFARRIFGEVDIPVLEEKYDEEKIPPFDNTRNMTLNPSNPLVATLLGWIYECLEEVAELLEKQEKERKSTEEAKKLEKQAKELEKILNNDFQTLQIELEKIRRLARQREEGKIEVLVPGTGESETGLILGGPEHGDGKSGDLAGPGDVERPGTSLLPGDEKGSPSQISEQKRKVSTFKVEYRHAGEQSPRSHYERETRTIVINLDHSQLIRSLRDSGGIESKQFKEMAYEIAFVEYAIALGYERLYKDEFYGGNDALYDMRDTINRISKAL